MKTIISTLLGNKKGLLSVFAEKTGKISFKRIASTMVIAWITSSIEPKEITTTHAIIIIACLASVLLPKLLPSIKVETKK